MLALGSTETNEAGEESGETVKGILLSDCGLLNHAGLHAIRESSWSK